MNKFLRYLAWIFIVVVLAIMVGLALLFPVLIVPLSLLVLFIVVWVINQKRKRKVHLENNIPADVLQDFEKAERRYVNSGGQISPQQILWEIARTKQSGVGFLESENKGVRVQPLPRTSFGREELQNNISSDIELDQPEVRSNKSVNRRRLFHRR